MVLKSTKIWILQVNFWNNLGNIWMIYRVWHPHETLIANLVKMVLRLAIALRVHVRYESQKLEFTRNDDLF